jgi:hypothetical protein
MVATYVGGVESTQRSRKLNVRMIGYSGSREVLCGHTVGSGGKRWLAEPFLENRDRATALTPIDGTTRQFRLNHLY